MSCLLNEPQVPRSVVFVVSRIPSPPYDGAMVVVSHTLQGLRQAGCHVTLIALNPQKHRVEATAAQQFCDELILVDIDTTVQVQGALKAVLERGEPLATSLPRASYQLQRFFSAELLSSIVERCRRPGQPVDVVHLDGLPMAWYGVALRQTLGAECPPWIYRSHNVEYRILEQQSHTSARPFWQRWYYRFLAWQTRRFEQEIVRRAPAVAAMSEIDAEELLAMGTDTRVIAVAPGMEVAPTVVPNMVQEEHGHATFKVGFLGSLEWEPNIEGLEWFVRTVWPTIRHQLPEATFTIAGRAPGLRVQSLATTEGVRVLGPVSWAAEFLAQQDVVVAPVLSGSGVRIKVLEGMAHGCAMVTTTRGAEGLSVVPGRQLVIADEPVAMAQACVALLSDPDERRRLAGEGQEFVRQKHSWQASIQQLLHVYRSALERCYGVS
jgi:glycosyltransferase involved in cell wall biosynthesis